jgi:hypothetical protein
MNLIFAVTVVAASLAYSAWAQGETPLYRNYGDAEQFADPKLGPKMRAGAAANDLNRCLEAAQRVVKESEAGNNEGNDNWFRFYAAKTIMMWLKLREASEADRQAWPESLVESYYGLSKLFVAYGNHIPQKWDKDLTMQALVDALQTVDPKITRTFMTGFAAGFKPIAPFGVQQ